MYGQPQFDHDIAALRLAQPLVFGPAIQPIRLPNPRQAVPLVRLTVTGWGLTAVSNLHLLFNLIFIKNESKYKKNQLNNYFKRGYFNCRDAEA